MFEKLKDYPVDPIMIGTELFAQDLREHKLDLTVGIYQDENGEAPILSSVKKAEQLLNQLQKTKAYTALTGDAEYRRAVGDAVFGTNLWSPQDFVAAQTAGGAVALRVISDVLAQMPTSPTVWLQTPSYGNYIPILTASGATFRSVPYYDAMERTVVIDQMLDGLREARSGDVFLMQGVCHNPTGADMTLEQFEEVLQVLEDRGIVPWIDLAYLGFDRGFVEDCEMARRIIARFPECIVCITLSKTFGIYRDRAGALFVKTKPADRERMHRAVSAIIRSGPSHAPDHGPSVVKLILQDDTLRNLWLDELTQMRNRVSWLRRKIVEMERDDFCKNSLAFLTDQNGMFSLLPLTPSQEEALTREHGIHVVRGGRVNVARLADGSDISYLISTFHAVTEN